MKVNGTTLNMENQDIKALNMLVIGESEMKLMNNFRKVYARKINECLHTAMENFQLLEDTS